MKKFKSEVQIKFSYGEIFLVNYKLVIAMSMMRHPCLSGPFLFILYWTRNVAC